MYVCIQICKNTSSRTLAFYSFILSFELSKICRLKSSARATWRDQQQQVNKIITTKNIKEYL